jgi:hypothetical protein
MYQDEESTLYIHLDSYMRQISISKQKPDLSTNFESTFHWQQTRLQKTE